MTESKKSLDELDEFPEMNEKEGLIVTSILLMEIIKEGNEDDMEIAARAVSGISNYPMLALKYWDRVAKTYEQVREQNSKRD